MKLTPIIAGLIGSATVATTIFSSSPAHALTWTLNNFTFSDLTTFSRPDDTVTGSFDYDGVSTISNVNIISTTNNVSTVINTGAVVTPPVGNRNYLFGSISGTYVRLVFNSSLPSAIPNFTTVSPLTSAIYTGNTAVSGNVSSVGVPFEIPGGATIPALGSILALGAMRKIRKSTATNALIHSMHK